MLSPYALGGLFGLGLVIARIVAVALTCPVRSLPGPWYSQFTNLVLKYYVIAGQRIYYVHFLHEKYGPVVRIAPREVSIADVQAAQSIHKIGSGFTKAAWYQDITHVTRPENEIEGNDGIFALRDPKQHTARRRLFARPFSANALQANWDSVVRNKVTLAVNKIQEEYETQGTADVLKWWTLMATDLIAHLSFGESFGSLEQGKQTPFIDALQTTVMASMLFLEIRPFHWVAPYLPFNSVRRLFTAERILVHYGGIAFQNMRKYTANAQNLFGQMLAAADSSEKAAMTDDTVIGEATNFIVAGSETTANTLTYLIWSVLGQPDLHKALEAEVLALSDDLTHDELVEAPLMNSVITETLRLYGAAPGSLPRDVPESGATLCGKYIRPGVVVTTQAYTLHRHPDVFPNPLQFDGWRFFKKQMTPLQKAAFMPFGGGTRICLGIHLAMNELRLATAMFFRQNRGVSLSPETTDESMQMAQYFLVAPISHSCKIVGPRRKS